MDDGTGRSLCLADAAADRLALVQRAEPLTVLFLLPALVSVPEVKYFSASLADIWLMVCNAHL